ncbi:hypothetical protein JVU11DRAFT_1110 [Chiua virens]|nr:hypothetical protein JVU11DRAFT_1110 [Chiua virens]
MQFCRAQKRTQQEAIVPRSSKRSRHNEVGCEQAELMVEKGQESLGDERPERCGDIQVDIPLHCANLLITLKSFLSLCTLWTPQNPSSEGLKTWDRRTLNAEGCVDLMLQPPQRINFNDQVFGANSQKRAMRPMTEKQPDCECIFMDRQLGHVVDHYGLVAFPTKQRDTLADWLLSHKSAPAAPEKVAAIPLGGESLWCDKPKAFPTTLRLPTDMKRHATVDDAIHCHSLQQPTPAQRIKGSPSRHSRPLPSSPVSPTHSLFSDPLEYEGSGPSHAPLSHIEAPGGRATLTQIPTYDPEAWNGLSFLVRQKGEGMSLATRDVPGRFATSRSCVSKQGKVAVFERWPITPDKAIVAPAVEIGSSNDPSVSSESTVTIEGTIPSPPFPPRIPRKLANFSVDFERINLGERVPVVLVDVENDLKDYLLRIGRIRSLGEYAEKDRGTFIVQ